MSERTALLVIDVQESFRHRPYWSDAQSTAFLDRLQALVDGAKARRFPVVQIFHTEETGPFSVASGMVRPLTGLSLSGDSVFFKNRHSALVGTGLPIWLTQHGIEHLIVAGIRTEQCCETTTRDASDRGYGVDFVTEATLTFTMTDSRGRAWSADEIKARTELVLADRFASIATVEQALARAVERRSASDKAA